MKFDRLEPCKSCPYRRDAPRKLWAPIEFAKLLADDASQLGKVYGCHQERKLPLAATTSYSCSRGHSFTVRERRKCPSCAWPEPAKETS